MSYVDVIKYTFKKLTIMLIFLSLMFMRIFVYVNSLYYTIILLSIILFLLYFLVSNLRLSALTMLMMAIVYIGAIIILIGYICAICPNIILSPRKVSPLLFLSLMIFAFIFYPYFSFFSFNLSSTPMVSYFYDVSGVLTFSVLVFMLFITLLIVTSQYITPKGPFRSLSS